MVSSTLCPAVHILGSQNVYGRAEGIADHCWPWAVFFEILKFFFCYVKGAGIAVSCGCSYIGFPHFIKMLKVRILRN